MDKVKQNLLKFSTDFCGRLKNFENKIQDVTIVAEVDGTIIQSHRIVLSIASNYFETMFTSGLKESNQDIIKINDISGTILTKLVHFCYTGELELDEGNVQSFATAALFLQFDNIADRCGEHMVKKMNVENCCSLAVFAEQHNFKRLYELSTQFLSENFEFIYKQEEDGLNQVSAKFLASILKRDDLVISSETSIFYAIEKWFLYYPEVRSLHLMQLLKLIRFQSLDSEFTRTILLDFCKKHKCDQIMALANVLQIKGQNKQEHELVSRKSHKLLKDEMSKRHLVAISLPNTLEYYSFRESQWKTLPCSKELNLNSNYEVIGVDSNNSSLIFTCTSSKSTVVKTHNLIGGADSNNVILLQPLFGAKSLVVNNAVYITGGGSRGTSTARVHKYDLITHEWSQLPNMLRQRNSHSVALVENHMYAIGGCDSYSSIQLMDYCEKYDFLQKRWQECNPMKFGRKECVATVLNGCIYVTGGFDNNGTYRDHIERFDPQTNGWTIVSAVTPLSQCFSIYGFENHLYLGGFGEKNQTLMVRCNPECNVWEDMPQSKNMTWYSKFVKCNLLIQSESSNLTTDS